MPNFPLVGTVPKGTAIALGVGGVGIAGYMIYRYKKKAKAQAAAVAASQQQANAQTSSGYGYGYGTPPGNGYYGYGEPYYGYGASGGFAAGYYGYGVTQPPQAAANTTNAQWAQAAVNQMTQEGYQAQTVSQALGAYELGQPVTADQQQIVQTAIGLEGYPPVPGTNGYPPSINTQGTPGGGTGGGQTSVVPLVVGMQASQAVSTLTQAGATKVNVSGPGTGTIWSQTPSGGSQAKPGWTIDIASGGGPGGSPPKGH